MLVVLWFFLIFTMLNIPPTYYLVYKRHFRFDLHYTTPPFITSTVLTLFVYVGFVCLYSFNNLFQTNYYSKLL